MLHIRVSLLSLAVVICLTAPRSPAVAEETTFRMMAWNIFGGGREDGKEVGPPRVIDVIRDSKADIVAMQETYGSGEMIAQQLDFHFQPRGTNVSVHSRFPIVEDISVFEPFKCVGALIELPSKQRIAVYSIWLPYGEDIWKPMIRAKSSDAEMLEACEPSAKDLTKMYAAIQKRLSDEKYEGSPLIIAGDFNSMSHLDYTEAAKPQYKRVLDWRTSHVLIDAGLKDSYRDLHPKVDREKDVTWSPKNPDQEQERIDYIYYGGEGLQAKDSVRIIEHAVKFPSDHAAVVTTFELSGN